MKFLLILFLTVPLLGQGTEQDKAVLLGLTVADVITTSYILSTGGMEANPIAAPMVENPGIYLAVRLVVTAIYLNSEPTKRQTRFLNGILGLFVANNLYQIMKNSEQ